MERKEAHGGTCKPGTVECSACTPHKCTQPSMRLCQPSPLLCPHPQYHHPEASQDQKYVLPEHPAMEPVREHLGAAARTCQSSKPTYLVSGNRYRSGWGLYSGLSISGASHLPCAQKFLAREAVAALGDLACSRIVSPPSAGTDALPHSRQGRRWGAGMISQVGEGAEEQ